MTAVNEFAERDPGIHPILRKYYRGLNEAIRLLGGWPDPDPPAPAPEGYVYLIDSNDFYITDDAGEYIIVPELEAV